MIRKFMDVSTGHMTLEDSSILARESRLRIAIEHTLPPIVIVDAFPYGWFFHLNKEAEQDAKEAGLSVAFQKIVAYAIENGCDMIRFDQDGEHMEEFKRFDW